MPVSKQKWLKLPSAQRGKLNYREYVAWTKKKTAQRARGSRPVGQTTVYDPFAPLSQEELQRRATETVRSQTQPVIREITANIGRQRKAGVADINKSTADAVKFLTPLAGQVGSTFDYSMNQTRRGGQEIAGFLKNAGLKEQADMAAQLQAAGLPGPGGENLGTSGGMAGAQALGYGTSALDLLAGTRASEVGFAKLQPGLTKRMGVQNISTLNKQYADKLADSIGQISQGVPGLVNTTMSSLMENEYRKAVAKKGFEMDKAKVDAANQPEIPQVDAQNSKNANDGLARDKYGHTIPDGMGGWVPWNPAAPPAGPASKFQARVDKALDKAFAQSQALRKAMITKLNPEEGIENFDPGGANKYITAQRKAAVAQQFAFWQQRFPGQKPEWIQAHVAMTLAQAGWKRDAELLGYGGTGTPKPGKPGKGAPKPVPPTGPAPSAPGEGNMGGTPALTGATPEQRSRFNRLVITRFNVLTEKGIGQVNKYKVYGLLSNYILREAYGLGYTIRPDQAWIIAATMLGSKGMFKKGSQPGNPGKYDTTYKVWHPTG